MKVFLTHELFRNVCVCVFIVVEFAGGDGGLFVF